MQTTKDIFSVLSQICDPEIPVISITDLGIVRSIRFPDPTNASTVEVVITPTYSGCPAMDVIKLEIRMRLLEQGFREIIISTQLSPAWTTAWMSDSGKEKLKAYGIAPPNDLQAVCDLTFFTQESAVQCPHCLSWHTALISQFGSTACKALYKCEDCLETFDYFKCH